MIEFIYNKAKNASTDHIGFELIYQYHPRIFFQDDPNPCSNSCLAEDHTKELRDLYFSINYFMLKNYKK